MNAKPFISRTVLKSVIFVFLSLPLLGAQDQEARNKDIRKRMESFTGLLQPSARLKVDRLARSLEEQIYSLAGKDDLYDLSLSAIKGQSGDLGPIDIESVAILVMSEVANSGEQALKEIMAEMHRTNQEKERQRDLIKFMKAQQASAKKSPAEPEPGSQMPPADLESPGKDKSATEATATSRLNIKQTRTPVLPPTPCQEEVIRNAEENLNSLDGISEQQQIELQEASDRNQKILGVIADCLKKISDSAESEIANLK
jgi:hypothetical protein